MAKIQDLLEKRLERNDSHKVKALAKRAVDAHLSGFSGLFKITELTSEEKMQLKDLLESHKTATLDIDSDLQTLTSITAEVKAIQNQAAILHGERIKKVQELCKKYADGAFSAWLSHTYGNRQTPYNFLLYYEFYEACQQELKAKLELMPRQAIYTLASRQVPHEKKEEIVRSYNGETKQELLEVIRSRFPLDNDDGRRSDTGEEIVNLLRKSIRLYSRNKRRISQKSRQEIHLLLKELEVSLSHKLS